MSNSKLYSVKTPINITDTIESYSFVFDNQIAINEHVFKCIENPLYSIVVNNLDIYKYTIYNLDKEQQKYLDDTAVIKYNEQSEWKVENGFADDLETIKANLMPVLFGNLSIGMLSDSKESAIEYFKVNYLKVLKHSVNKNESIIKLSNKTINDLEKSSDVFDKKPKVLADFGEGTKLYQNNNLGYFTEIMVDKIELNETGQTIVYAKLDRTKQINASGIFSVVLAKVNTQSYRVMNVVDFTNKTNYYLLESFTENGIFSDNIDYIKQISNYKTYVKAVQSLKTAENELALLKNTIQLIEY